MAKAEAIEDMESVGTHFDTNVKRELDKKSKNLRAANLHSVFGGGVGRLSLMVVGGAFLLIFVVGGYKLFGKGRPVAPPPQASNAMIDAPGSQGADSYAANGREAQMRRASNEKQAAAARAKGAAYIAPPVLEAKPKPQPSIVTIDTGGLGGPKGTPEEQRRQLQSQGAANSSDPAYMAAQQQRNAQLAQMTKLMETLKKDDIMPQIAVASGLGWKGEPVKPFSTSDYALPDRAKAQQVQATSTSQKVGGPAGVTLPVVAPKQAIFSAGDGCYGVMDYSINTDNPGNVAIATIPLCKGIKNMKVIGTYGFSDQAQAVSITFNKLVIPGKPTTPIQAIAVDNKTFGTGIADDVDNHYFRRFGLTALASFISGIGKAAQVVVGTSTTTSSGLSSQTMTVQEPMSTSREAKIALGETGQQLGDELKQQNANVKPTVKVYGPKQGDRGIGVVFLADVY